MPKSERHLTPERMRRHEKIRRHIWTGIAIIASAIITFLILSVVG